MRRNLALALSAAAGLGLIALTSVAVESRPKADFGKASEEMAKAATAFLNALTPEQQAKAKFDFKDAERLNWHFIPKERKGLTIKDMKPEQRHLAQALLATGLSPRGYEKATTIMTLEQILQEMEGANRRFPRDPQLYHFFVFGTPAAKGTWGWRVEGHHLSLNFTLAAGKAISATPSFFGSNPGQVKDGPRKGLRVLGTEEDLGRQLAKSLNGDQQALGIFSKEAPKDILLMPGQKVRLLDPAGISASKLTPDQVKTLKSIVSEYATHHRGELAEQDLAKIEKAGWDGVSFAWAGGLDLGQGHYYRVQGPTFVLEYDNTQNNANHVHAVWHDSADNFGADILKKHYEQDHK